MKYRFFAFLLCIINIYTVSAQRNHGVKFEQLGNLLPDGNIYRGMNGAPGPEYWQQQCDYDIECTLDAENHMLYGTETISYTNRSPHTLQYLWLQLDENQHSQDNDNQYFDPSSISGTMSEAQMRQLDHFKEKEGYGVNITRVEDGNGNALNYFINQTMMRIDLPQPLEHGENVSFEVDWNYKIINRIEVGKIGGGHATNLARGGYEHFEKDGNDLFTMTQWYPRLCAFTDYGGWQNNQFTGRMEFALTFGNFVVKMTVPEDHVVGSTGECLNYSTVLSKEELMRWNEAQTASEPVEIVTLDEAKSNETAARSEETKTWIFKADMVRDFAWTSSPKFIWDAMPHTTSDGKKVMCMSYYPKEAYPIYRKFSTKAVTHTLASYSRYSIPYPYPVAISVEAASGMEYPMICFNPGRAEEDGTYSEAAKKSAISVIIHEVGHNYFPMIINSDERQWAWFDEGLNSFVQFLAEQEWNPDYVSWFGPAAQIAPYMSLPKDMLEPIMTNGENVKDYGNNAYSKPAAALNILRETIMGRELFDMAFKEYCSRWAFKHPTPADFFRTMEDASGVDLDWFWNGWFYTTDAVDISLDTIIWWKVDLENDPEKTFKETKIVQKKPAEHISQIRNKASGKPSLVEQDEELQDFYYNYEPWNTADSILSGGTYLYEETYDSLEKEKLFGDKNYYELTFSNQGGLVMPIILEWTYEDGSTEIDRIPVQIWRKNEAEVTKVFVKDKVVTSVVLDPYKETADIVYQIMPGRFVKFQVGFRCSKLIRRKNYLIRCKRLRTKREASPQYYFGPSPN